jgi:hypothetical protein
VPTVAEVYTSHIKASPLRSSRVLCKDDGQPISRCWTRVRYAAERAEVSTGVHILRHKFCAHLVMRGAAMRSVHELVGHQDLTMTVDSFVGACVINFSTFERHIEFVRVDGSFIFITGLETLVPVVDTPAAGPSWSGARLSDASPTREMIERVRAAALEVPGVLGGHRVHEFQ